VGRRAAPGEGSDHFVALGRLEALGFYARIARASQSLATQVFRLSPGEVRRMKEVASAELEGTGRWVSTNDAITAHLWKSLAELRGRADDGRESLGLIASVRDRLAPELPPHYFGNCASHVTPTMTAGDLRAKGIGEVALRVRRGLEDISLARLRGDIAFLAAHAARAPGGKVFPRMMLDVFDGCVVFNNWSKLPFYAIDFGGGAPFWYEFPEVPIPWLTLIAPTPAGDGGRDVRLSLPVDKIASFHSLAWQAVLHRYEQG
jgi:shikimate O-hydroxycinnamoyltransferase